MGNTPIVFGGPTQASQPQAEPALLGGQLLQLPTVASAQDPLSCQRAWNQLNATPRPPAQDKFISLRPGNPPNESSTEMRAWRRNSLENIRLAAGLAVLDVTAGVRACQGHCVHQ